MKSTIVKVKIVFFTIIYTRYYDPTFDFMQAKGHRSTENLRYTWSRFVFPNQC